jgi:hypothetical protein
MRVLHLRPNALVCIDTRSGTCELQIKALQLYVHCICVFVIFTTARQEPFDILSSPGETCSTGDLTLEECNAAALYFGFLLDNPNGGSYGLDLPRGCFQIVGAGAGQHWFYNLQGTSGTPGANVRRVCGEGLYSLLDIINIFEG